MLYKSVILSCFVSLEFMLIHFRSLVKKFLKPNPPQHLHPSHFPWEKVQNVTPNMSGQWPYIHETRKLDICFQRNFIHTSAFITNIWNTGITKGWMVPHWNFSVSLVSNSANLSLYRGTFLDLTKVIQTLDAVFITGTLWLIFSFTWTVTILYHNNPRGRKNWGVFHLEAVISIHYRDFHDNHDISLQH